MHELVSSYPVQAGRSGHHLNLAPDPTHNVLEAAPSAEVQQCKRTTGNRLTLLGSHHYRYDEYGNCIQDAHSKDQSVVIHYRWNGEHRLVGMTRTHRGKEVASFTYDYDCFGRRIRKHNVLTGETRLFFWQDDRLVAECDEKLACPGGHPTAFGSAPHSDATNCRAYIYEPSVDGRHSFRPLAMIAGRDKNTALYYYLNDHLGTPQELVTARGDIVWSAVFYSYGQMRFTLANDVPQPLRFQGQYYDEESGLSYNRYRYYDDCALRYLSPDPIGLAGGINAYAYVPSPLTWVDPLGLDGCPPVSVKTTASNGLDYLSNPKHTLGGAGNSPKAGIEPRNSLDLFGKSILGKNGNRFAIDSDGNLHRFASTNDGTWHWNGSTGQASPRPSLMKLQVGNDVVKHFGLPKKGW